jgi:hypothetical protein
MRQEGALRPGFAYYRQELDCESASCSRAEDDELIRRKVTDTLGGWHRLNVWVARFRRLEIPGAAPKPSEAFATEAENEATAPRTEGFVTKFRGEVASVRTGRAGPSTGKTAATTLLHQEPRGRTPPTMEDLIEQIGVDMNPSQRRDVYEMLLRVLGNITAKPSEPKHRTLKKDNNTVAETLLKHPAAVGILLAAGFEDLGETLHCPGTADLGAISEAVLLIKGFVASFDVEEQALARTAATTRPHQEPRAST